MAWHPLADTLWLRFRREAGPVLAACEAALPAGVRYLREEGMTPDTWRRLRPLVPMPGVLTWNVEQTLVGEFAPPGVSDDMAAPAARIARAQQRRPDGAMGLLGLTCTAFAAWRVEKRVYRLAPALAAGLRDTRWPGKFPAAQVHLPAAGIAIDVPAVPDAELAAQTLLAFYDLRTGTEGTGALELRITALRDGPAATVPLLEPVATLDLTAATLDDALASSRGTIAEQMRRRAADPTLSFDQMLDDLEWSGRNARLRLALNTILYLLGAEDVVADVRDRVPLPRRGSSAPPSRDPARAARDRDLATPATYTVGLRYAAAIERQLRLLDAGAEPAGESESGTTTRHVRPHIRGPHPHLYWTGPGRQIARVHYLPPTLVKGGPPDGEAPVPTVRRVR